MLAMTASHATLIRVMKTKIFLPAILVLSAGAFALVLVGCASRPPLATVPQVNLKQYAGKWYEVARYPNWFQRNCNQATATYTPQDDGTITVFNTCIAPSGKEKTISGVATVVPGSGNAKLKVKFFGPLAGDYWIIGLDPEYKWAVVGHPSRRYLWILSRSPQLPEATYEHILQLIRSKGYDPARLIRG